jgi:hypothetical protein
MVTWEVRMACLSGRVAAGLWVQVILILGGYVEPPHVHIEREAYRAKFWLDPVRLHESGGFDRSEINRIQRLVEENAGILLGSWNEYFER